MNQVSTDLLTRGGKDIAFSDYSPLWKSHRRLVHNAFNLFGEGTSRLQDIGTFLHPSVLCFEIHTGSQRVDVQIERIPQMRV